jgi:aromatic ring-cleaving dioxygenase
MHTQAAATLPPCTQPVTSAAAAAAAVSLRQQQHRARAELGQQVGVERLVVHRGRVHDQQIGAHLVGDVAFGFVCFVLFWMSVFGEYGEGMRRS